MNNLDAYAKEIRDALPPEELYAQLAEESAELAQAALKMRRALTGKNPTPVTLEEARANLIEELADVMVCQCIVDIGDSAVEMLMLFNKMGEKTKRWRDRLKEGAEV